MPRRAGGGAPRAFRGRNLTRTQRQANEALRRSGPEGNRARARNAALRRARNR